jgi:UDP-glucose 4-epimerase
MTTEPPSLSGQPVLVTGASGFIGSALVRRLLDDGVEIYAISRNPPVDRGDRLRWLQGSLEDLGTVRRVFEIVNPRYIFHLASHVTGARDVKLVTQTFASNLASTVHLLTVAAEHGCDRIVFTGSLEEPTNPDAVPSSPYAAAKQAATAYARMFHALFGIPVVVLRLFMVYGPGQADLTKLVPSVIISLLRGQPPRITSGRREIDWIFVDDVVAALIAAVKAPRAVGTTLDVGSGTLVSIRVVVDQLVQLVNPRVHALFGAVPDRPFEQVRMADTTNTTAVLGWKPSMTLEEGLRRTVEWYAERFR